MANLPEGFDLARLLDPADDYSETTSLNDVEASAIADRADEDNVDHYVDRENEIIAMLVSLQNLMKNDDGGMQHLLKNRDTIEDETYIDNMLRDAEQSTMDLYNLQSALRSQNVNESRLRSYIRKLILETRNRSNG